MSWASYSNILHRGVTRGVGDVITYMSQIAEWSAPMTDIPAILTDHFKKVDVETKADIMVTQDHAVIAKSDLTFKDENGDTVYVEPYEGDRLIGYGQLFKVVESFPNAEEWVLRLHKVS